MWNFLVGCFCRCAKLKAISNLRTSSSIYSILLVMQDTYEKYLSLVCCSYFGNRYLLMDKSICTPKNTNNNKLILILTRNLLPMATIERKKYCYKPLGTFSFTTITYITYFDLYILAMHNAIFFSFFLAVRDYIMQSYERSIMLLLYFSSCNTLALQIFVYRFFFANCIQLNKYSASFLFLQFMGVTVNKYLSWWFFEYFVFASDTFIFLNAPSICLLLQYCTLQKLKEAWNSCPCIPTVH